MAIMAASCGPKAQVKLTVAGAPESQVVLKDVDCLIDTVKTNKSGSLSYTLKMEAGQPRFVYAFYNGVKIASLLISEGEKAVVMADTLGNYTVSGSPESEKLLGVEQDYAKFMKDMYAAEDSHEMTRTYISYYRDCVRYVIGNPYSLTVVPVLFQELGPQSPIFSQTTDAIHFTMACDSLKTVYPDSKYVKLLQAEANKRSKTLDLDTKLKAVNEIGFPDLQLPGMNGQKVSLAGVKSKVVLVHFWNAADPAQLMFNQDVLKPLYETYHKKGLEIYAVCLSADKKEWAAAVRNQKLPWINVNDGLGIYSTAPALYNVGGTPTTVIIADGSISSSSISGEAGLRKELDRILK